MAADREQQQSMLKTNSRKPIPHKLYVEVFPYRPHSVRDRLTIKPVYVLHTLTTIRSQ